MYMYMYVSLYYMLTQQVEIFDLVQLVIQLAMKDLCKEYIGALKCTCMYLDNIIMLHVHVQMCGNMSQLPNILTYIVH